MEETFYDLTILVVEDDNEANLQLSKMLKRRVREVLSVHNGKEGLEYFKTRNIDLIITDVNMPTMDGLEMATSIKEINDNIPIILLTGLKDLEVLVKAVNIHISNFIQKPVDFDELMKAIHTIYKVQQLKKEISFKNNLIEQYKQTVDRSSIVSKTDPRGIITYVNEQFCIISGYKEEELLGYSHNIVRHPDMESNLFEFLWYTIKQLKQPWIGEIKNRRKDGTSYWVHSVINPILDTNGNIVEYIAIRTDITQQKTIANYFESQLKISTKNFEKAFQLQKEYEKAIDSSNILSRTDLKGKITYINNEFKELTGYTESELIGKPHSIIRHPDIPKEFFFKLWSTIKQGNIWKGIIKNKKKNGDAFWAATSIIPIKNESGEIVEYMAIRHDLTELFALHTEIESTQKEIVYKMGEIGESRSKETGNHVKRVAEYSKLLAILYGLDYKEAEILLIASPMHDIGKVAIPDYILKKPGKLDADEWEIMKTHSSIGYNVLKGSNRDILKAASIVAHEHHEKWDGTGYPRGLKGEEIHIYGRITAIADVFDALGSDRCYKKAWDLDKILDLFKTESGRHFDPHLIGLFLKHLQQFLEIRDKFKD